MILLRDTSIFLAVLSDSILVVLSLPAPLRGNWKPKGGLGHIPSFLSPLQGGRAVLCLYGYSNQQPDGLSFPDDVMDPNVGCVAAVTLEVMSLRMELEMLIKVCVCVCFAVTIT